MLRIVQNSIYKNFNNSCARSIRQHSSTEQENKKESERLKEFRKKLQETRPLGATGIKKDKMVEQMSSTKHLRAKAPLEKLEELEEGMHPYQEKEPLEPFPDNINPKTGEQDGPKGPEPTRYGDWERKGRVTDF
ncbi:succinate dehydrogenase assembly factor 4, mitochondrial-like [Phymastichus coffea]|uniref:succinate dehydrogenase assembly factor 4, mitochondrial-like n=1 Tax=Phymastichus coffea TaxID=108790 RepID=UPI00273C9886|nr:succinate dehydrogenase assembly factor 4, mitochondrial-like [Phymastichus coffea]XP_058792076.1 succinate dehydrogenase assembly factor 4, mitochondrial-like [Phymastichus coffea]